MRQWYMSIKQTIKFNIAAFLKSNHFGLKNDVAAVLDSPPSSIIISYKPFCFIEHNTQRFCTNQNFERNVKNQNIFAWLYDDFKLWSKDIVIFWSGGIETFLTQEEKFEKSTKNFEYAKSQNVTIPPNHILLTHSESIFMSSTNFC